MAETLILALYRNEDRNVMRRYLPLDDVRVRRQLLYRRLFGKFEEMDGVYPFVSVKHNPIYSANKQKEVEALHVSRIDL